MTALFRMFFSPSPETYSAHTLYVALSDAARNPFLFEQGKVPDTIDGRFDMIVAHLFLTLERIKREAGSEPFQQALMECFFSSLDRSLREMGVADLGVGKRIRKMADACHGRLTRYQTSWADAATKRAAIFDNIYRGDTALSDAGMDVLLSRLSAFEAALAATSYEALREGRIAPSGI